MVDECPEDRACHAPRRVVGYGSPLDPLHVSSAVCPVTDISLDKPWNKRSSLHQSLPKKAAHESGLPSQLLELVKNTPAQQGPIVYDEVDAWWWIVYDAVVQEMQAKGMDRDLAEMANGVAT